MKRPFRLLLGLLGCLLCSPALLGGELPPDLKDNEWVEIDDGGAGARIGPAAVWLPTEKKFLVLGGMTSLLPSQRKPYDVQTFDPATGKWENCFPTGKEKEWVDGEGNAAPPKFGHSGNYVSLRDALGNERLTPTVRIDEYFAFDAEANAVYVALGGHTLRGSFAGKALPIVRYNVADRTWEEVSTSGPPVAPEYGDLKMSNTSMVVDPTNKELLFLGGWGGRAGLKDGTVGSWAFSLTDKKWRQLDSPSATLDPLFAKARRATDAVRDAMAAARNTFYRGSDAGEEAAAVKLAPLTLTAESEKLAADLIASINSAVGRGWEREALRGKALAATALERLQIVRARFADGELDASLLKRMFDAHWELDLAAECLRSSPAPRVSPAAAYDPVHRVVVQTGGSHFDYLANDTWIYDCRTKAWRQVWPAVCPAPRKGASMVYLPKSNRLALVGGKTTNARFTFYDTFVKLPTDVWVFEPSNCQWKLLYREIVAKDAPKKSRAMSSPLAVSDRDVALGLFTEKRGSTGQGNAIYCSRTRMFRIAETDDSALTEKYGFEPSSRVYHSIVDGYNPTWYDAAPRGNRAETESRLKSMPANAWNSPPPAPRVCPQSEWGTAVYDPQRDALYLWTGGHQSDCSNQIAIFHPGINRWSIPYVPGGASLMSGRYFNNRPSAPNHTYMNYTYDPYSERMVASSPGGIAVYNPDRRDWEYMGAAPYVHNHYYVKLRGTSRGVVIWAPGYLGLFDAKTKTFKDLPKKGDKLPGFFHGDKNILVWDSKRDVLYMMSTTNYSTANGQVWRYDMKSGQVDALNPKNQQEIGASTGDLREAVYLPKLDLVLLNNFVDKRQVAFDPANLRFVLLNIPPAGRMGRQANSNLAYDSKRDLIWGLCGGNEVRVLRIDPKSLKIEDNVDAVK